MRKKKIFSLKAIKWCIIKITTVIILHSYTFNDITYNNSRLYALLSNEIRCGFVSTFKFSASSLYTNYINHRIMLFLFDIYAQTKRVVACATSNRIGTFVENERYERIVSHFSRRQLR